jgi:hypothetical protein
LLDRAGCIDLGGAWHEGVDCAAADCLAQGDDCLTDSLSVTDGAWAFDNRCAETDGPVLVDCDTGNQPFRHDLWFEYVATCDGIATFSLCGDTDYDAIMAVYSDGSPTCGCPVDDTTQIGLCGDDTCDTAGGPPELKRFVAAGECLTLRVGGWSEQSGTGTLHIACEPAACATAPSPLPEATPRDKSRYLTFIPPTTEYETAYRLRVLRCDGFPDYEGTTWWLGEPRVYSDATAADPDAVITVSRLQCEPHFTNWNVLCTVHVIGAEILPESEYELEATDQSCSDSLDDPSAYSPALGMATGVWGDVAPSYAVPGGPTQPDFNDIAAIVEAFLAGTMSPGKPRAQLQPNVPDPSLPVDFRDIADGVSAFLGRPYPYQGPCPCPTNIFCNQIVCSPPTGCSNGLCVDGYCRDACARCIEP